ncbi:MAG: hypothetical protein ABI323_00245 [Solirubrobacteraceae bacterium]
MALTAKPGGEALTVGPLEILPEEHLARARGRAPELVLIHTHFGFGYRLAAKPKSQSNQRFTTG